MTDAACWFCSKPIQEADSFCRHCGHGQGDKVEWYYRPAPIIALMVFALGPFVLPLVWRSPRISPRGRWIFTGIAVFFTAYLVYITLLAIRLFSTLKGALTM